MNIDAHHVEPFTDADVVARHLDTSPAAVYAAVHSKGLPVHRVGRFFRFKLSEVDRWATSGAAAGPEGGRPGRRTGEREGKRVRPRRTTE